MQTQPGWMRGRFDDCYQCGKTWETVHMNRRPVVTLTQTHHLWWKFRPQHFTFTQMVSLCPYCTQEHDAAQQVQRQKRLLLVGSTGLGFFSWVYLGTTGLIGAVAVILIGALYRWRSRTSLPQIRGNVYPPGGRA